MIKFGTDGWRAVISDEFTFENVRVVAQSIADYVLDTTGGQPVIAIGYDTRFLSDKFAQDCAKVLAANGIKVLLSDKITPTPTLSYAVKNRRATGGIVITASHNPYQYNGIKYKAGYGGSALPDMISQIERRLYSQKPKTMNLEEAVTQGSIQYFNAEEEYYDQLRSLVDLQKIVQAGLRVIIDPMHGAGAGFIKRLLASEGMEVMEVRGLHNPLFGGVNPEPIRQNLQVLVDAVGKQKAHAGFATDGDADRIGVVDARGEFVNSHIIYALLLRFLISEKKWSGGVVKTFSTSQMIDKLASEFGIPVFETPIGFKYICELFLKEDILLGGEESGGLGFKNHIPERDGILSSLLLMEIMATYGKNLGEIISEMMQKIGHYYYERVDLHLKREIMASAMEALKKNQPQEFVGVKVKEKLTLDGTKFMLEDGSWILFRASGTEPVVRVYAEAGSIKKVQALITEGVKRLTHN